MDDLANEDESLGEQEQELLDEYNPKTRWGIPQSVDSVAFVGKDVIAVANDMYVFFTNIKTGAESVFTANSRDKGDGIDCFDGHKSGMFVFAEKTTTPRIMTYTYPQFQKISHMDDGATQSYISLSLVEGNDMLISFSSYPNFVVILWNWRNSHKLVTVPTDVSLEDQLISVSKTHPFISQCWRTNLAVWEVGECFKNCLMMKRIRGSKEVEVRCQCWTIEGQLYIMDEDGCLCNMSSDGAVMVRNLEWTPSRTGDKTPLMCALAGGLLIYCDDGVLRFLKRIDKKWTEVWTLQENLDVIQMISNQSCDVAVVWTENGRVHRLVQPENEKDKIIVTIVSYKQRNIKKMQLLAPSGKYLVTVNDASELCIYEVATGVLLDVYNIRGNDLQIRAYSHNEMFIIAGEVGTNYGIALYQYAEPLFKTDAPKHFKPEDEHAPKEEVEEEHKRRLVKLGSRSLTDQIISRIVVSKDGRFIAAVAMDAGNVFIMKTGHKLDLSMVRNLEVGRALADCLFCIVAGSVRIFPLVLFSDKYRFGERLMCVDCETGRDNKVSGKMQGPYQKLVAMAEDDLLLMIPFMSTNYHILKITGGKGISLSVRIIKIINSGHEAKYFKGILSSPYMVTFDMAGRVIVRKADISENYEFSLPVSHRLECGVKYIVTDPRTKVLTSLANNGTLAVNFLDANDKQLQVEPDQSNIAKLEDPKKIVTLDLFPEDEPNWLDVVEAKLVEQERIDFAERRAKVVAKFEQIQAELVELLEENYVDPPLHQLPIQEFDLYYEARQARTKQAAEDREKLRRQIEAQIAAQDKVTQWMREQFWDIMKVQRTKLRAIFSHNEVENYATLPSERDHWIELQRIKCWREIEMENDHDVFKPWLAITQASRVTVTTVKQNTSIQSITDSKKALEAKSQGDMSITEEEDEATKAAKMMLSFAFSGTLSHLFIKVPAYDINQMLVYAFLQTRYLQEIIRLKDFLLRDWFNKEFDNLMATKKREVGLVSERNSRLRVIISELNKLAELRGSVHYIMNQVYDPEWEQDEEPDRIMTVIPKEVSITPYISPSQIVLTPPTPKPKDDFKERALIEMMDGVLEKLWHEEIKKPIPKPQCMIEKEPEHWNEEDLRIVFDYERKVEFRNQEREKYRHMLHTEWTKLTDILNDGVVRFNARVNDLFILKLNVESSIGQENLNLMRFRRINLDKMENYEDIQWTRSKVKILESSLEFFQKQLRGIRQAVRDCQSAYEAQTQRDRALDRNFKNSFTDQSPVVQDQCYKLFKRRPKWQAKATSASVLWTLAAAAVHPQKYPPLLPTECTDFLKGIDNLDSIVNMPPVLAEPTWATMCKLRRLKIESECKLRALVAESAASDSTGKVWAHRITALKHSILAAKHKIVQLQTPYRNIQIQLVLPAGAVEVVTTGHIIDFEDAAVILKEDVVEINKLILKVGAIKLAMIRRQIAFRAAIIAKEWEHELLKIKLKHMREELYNYERIKLPKELQEYLKDRAQGYPEDEELSLLEKEADSARQAHRKRVAQLLADADGFEDKRSMVNAKIKTIEDIIYRARLLISEKRLKGDPLEQARRVRARKTRMNVIVERTRLVSEVQDNHTTIILLQTQLELLKLKTFPTLASFEDDLKELRC